MRGTTENGVVERGEMERRWKGGWILSTQLVEMPH